jgi:hypothetical protein
MSRKLLPALAGGLLGLGLWAGAVAPASAQPVPQPPAGAAPAPAPLPAPTAAPATGADIIPPTAGLPVPYHALNRFYYYPYYYYPHNYWPMMSPRWPEPVGQCYQRPPAYMAFPPFKEPHWRYEYWQPQTFYRGFHFWLDVF